MRYLIMPYLCQSVFGWGKKRLKVSRSLVENLDAPKGLTGMSDQIFEWKTFDLAHIFQAILNPDPNGPKVYAVDTEFYRPSTKGSSIISEVAFINVKKGQIVLHAVLDDDKRATEASTKLALQKSNKESLTAKDAPQVRPTTDLFQQLRDCHFGPDDIIVEWSIKSTSILDVQLIRSFLLQNGYDDQSLLPSGGYAVLGSTQKFLEQVLKLRSWSLPFLFRVLFPQDPLIDQNHSAVIDAIQLAQILRLSAELTKAPKKRILPEGLLQGFKELAWLDDEHPQSNTLDHYLESVGRNTSDGADGKIYVQEDDEEDVNNEDIGDEDIDDEDTDDENIDDDDDEIVDEGLDEEDVVIDQDMLIDPDDAGADIGYHIAQEAFCSEIFETDDRNVGEDPKA